MSCWCRHSLHKSHLLVDIQGVLRRELVARPDDKFEFVDGDAKSDEESFEQEGVIFRAPLDSFKGRFACV